MIPIVKIFRTLDGEVTFGGPLQWTVFVRTAGCPLRCWKSSGFCDAPHTLDLKLHDWPEYGPADLTEMILAASRGIRRVTITGGEPLMWRRDVVGLAGRLQDEGCFVVLETSGSVGLTAKEMEFFTCIVCDIKTPTTEESEKMDWDFVERLRPTDKLKAVVETLEDLDWVREKMREHHSSAQVCVGPRWGTHGLPGLEPALIVDWMDRKGRYTWRLNLQLHKYIWPECHPQPVDKLEEVDHARQVEIEH